MGCDFVLTFQLARISEAPFRKYGFLYNVEAGVSGRIAWRGCSDTSRAPPAGSSFCTAYLNVQRNTRAAPRHAWVKYLELALTLRWNLAPAA